MDGAAFPTEPGAFSLDSLTYAQLLTQAVQGMDTGDQHDATQVRVGSVGGWARATSRNLPGRLGRCRAWMQATSTTPPRQVRAVWRGWARTQVGAGSMGHDAAGWVWVESALRVLIKECNVA